MKISLIILFILISNQSFAQRLFDISFDGYLETSLDDYDRAVRRQVIHSYGPLTNTYSYGDRSTLNTNYNYKILKETKLKNGIVRLDYRLSGQLLAEDNIDINNFKVVVPIMATKTLKLVKKQRQCAKKGGTNGLHSFYYSWSPYFEGCNLVKGEAFEEFSLNSFELKQNKTDFSTNEILNNNELNIFYYFGADFYKLMDAGYARTERDLLVKKLWRMGFRYKDRSFNSSEIFGYSRTQSEFKRMRKTINGVEVNVHMLLGNPTESTPKQQKEFFRFFKYAFKHGSYIHYTGHSGFGSVLDFGYLEEIYKEKIDYNPKQKQFIYLFGCSSFFDSTKFFTSRKEQGSLVLVTNGLKTRSDFGGITVNTAFDTVLSSLEDNSRIIGNDFINTINEKMRKRIGVNVKHFNLVNIFSN